MSRKGDEAKSRAARYMDKPEEARHFDMSMRGTCPDLKDVHLYTDRRDLVVGTLMSFDKEYDGATGISYFLGSLLSSMIHTTIREFRNRGIVLDEIEGIIHARLKNPLRMIPVRGYEDPSEIEDIQVKLFYYADGDPQVLDALVVEVQEFNPIFRLVRRGTPVEVEAEWVL